MIIKKYLDKWYRIGYTTTCKEKSFTGGVFMKEMVMDDKLKEIVELAVLFDFYGELLKDHNKQVFEDYILNDLSLGEIAEEKGISRQGVFDIIKRCSKQLKDCEEKLNLIKKFELTKSKVNQIKDTAEQLKDFSVVKEKSQSETSEVSIGLEKIIQLADRILHDL